MRAVLLLAGALACAHGARAWPVPSGWKSETIPFPLDFAPALAHRGVEELRFAAGFFDPHAGGYWSYAFAWRLDDAAALDADALAAELAAYFRGLVHAVKPALPTDTIVAHAERVSDGFTITARVLDAFGSGAPVDLVGTATRRACGSGALWVFVLAPKATAVRDQLVALAGAARC